MLIAYTVHRQKVGEIRTASREDASKGVLKSFNDKENSLAVVWSQLKGVWHEIFDFIVIFTNQIFMKICKDIHNFVLIDGVVWTDDN
jgi:hypothetical protein